MLQLGLLGTLPAVAALLVTILRALVACGRGTLPWAGFAAVYLLSFFATSLVESLLFRAGDVHCMMLPLIYAALRLGMAKPDSTVARSL